MTKIILLFFTFFVCDAYGQIPILDELITDTCSFDSSASAMIISAKGETTFDNYNSTIIKYYYRIKIFKKEALNDWANIILDAGKGEISNIEGTTYNWVNGKIVETKLKKESIFKAKLTKTKNANRISMPNVREGSVIEYSYDRRIFGYFIPSWNFQQIIPTAFSQYEVKIPFNGELWEDFKNARVDIRGPHKLKSYESKNEVKYQKWVMENLPGFKAEPLMPHPDIYFSRIVFWLTGKRDWSTINVKLLRDVYFGGILYNRPPLLKEKVSKIISGVKDTTDIIKKLSGWIKDSLDWNGYNDFYADNFHSEEILKKKKGNAGDLNLLLGAMLMESGLDVDMVLISTRGNGFIREEIASLWQFDYVVCMVSLSKTERVFLDATEKYLPFNLLPERCLNYKGFVVSKKRPGWLQIKPSAKKTVSIIEDLDLSKGLTSSGRLTVIAEGYLGWSIRKAFFEEVDFKNPYLGDFKNKKQVQTNFKNQNERERPFVIEQVLEEKKYGQINSNKVYLNPFEDLSISKKPFTSTTREYPVEFDIPINETITVNIILPKDAIVDELPRSMAITLHENAARFFFQVSQVKEKIIITSRFQVNNSFILQDEYPKLRELYAQMLSKRDEMIVFSIKNE